MANADPNTNTIIARSFHSNIVKFLRQQEKACFRRFPVTDEIMSRGRIKYNAGGLGLQWEVQYKLHPTTGNDGTTPLTFANHDQWLNASLGYRGFSCTDSIYEKEMLENRGEEALVKVFGTMASRMERSMEEAFKFMPYRDGSSSSDKLPQGIETFMTLTGTLDLSAGTAPATRSANSADLVGWPTGSYAGLTCTLGNYGGSYRTTIATSAPYMNWPMGQADTEFDFWTPIVGNYDSDSLPGSTHTWAGQATAAIRFTHDHLNRNGNGNADANLCLMERSMYTDLCTLQETKEHTYVTDAKPGAKQYGFGPSIYVDTLRCQADYALTSRVAYIFNLNDLEVVSMYPTLFKTNTEPDYDMPSQSYRYASLALLNLKFSSPAKYAKLAMLAT